VRANGSVSRRERGGARAQRRQARHGHSRRLQLSATEVLHGMHKAEGRQRELHKF